jgi:hypothetical protein
MLTELAIAVRNPEPDREMCQPRTWLLYRHGEAREIQIMHDEDNKPHVLDKRVPSTNPIQDSDGQFAREIPVTSQHV